MTYDEEFCQESATHPQAVEQAIKTMPLAVDVEQASVFLKLVADPTRLKILSALSQVELCVCDLAVVVGMSESAISHQLRLLRTGKVVKNRKEGRVVYYSLLDHHVTILITNALEHARE